MSHMQPAQMGDTECNALPSLLIEVSYTITWFKLVHHCSLETGVFSPMHQTN